jgi:hypothetical protein
VRPGRRPLRAALPRRRRHRPRRRAQGPVTFPPFFFPV